MSTLHIWPEAWAQGLWPGQSPNRLLLESKLAHSQHASLLRGGSWGATGSKEQLLNPLLSSIQSPSVRVLLLSSNSKSVRVSPTPQPMAGQRDCFPSTRQSWEAPRSWAVPPLACCFLPLMQIAVLTLHQGIWAHLRSRKAGPLLLRRETSVSLTRLRAITLFI